MTLPNETEAGKKRLEQFILESIRLDSLLDARVRDIEFIKSGGEVLYTPDESTWNSFFFPVMYGQAHPGKQGGPVSGFSEVYLESDRSVSSYYSGAPLTGKQVTGMLGKILMDAIFAPQTENGPAPVFFLTKESKDGLNEAIKTVNISRTNRSRNKGEQQAIASVLSSLKSEFSSADGERQSESLFLRTPNNLMKAGALAAFLDDANLINLNDRIATYQGISFFDWAHIVSGVDEGHREEMPFDLRKSDVREFERLKNDFVDIFRRELPLSAENKVASISEVLALNYIATRSQNNSVRIIYLTNAPWAIRYFDRFVWDENASNPLRFRKDVEIIPTVSSIFVRSPLCFLHDIELRPEDKESRGALKVFVDSVVPRKLHDDTRMDTSSRKRTLISKALDDLEARGQLDAYLIELDKFYEQWAEKKVPWVNVFFAQRASHWAEGLKLFSEEGFYNFWRKVNRDFTRLSWQFGIYLALMTEGLPARAAPLVFIDCDGTTNQMLSALQLALAREDIEGFRNQIHQFHERSSEGREERREYFDALVIAVLFMFSSQFETSKLHAETACELAMKSTDPDVTGREAYYLRSYLVRITAADRLELETARKLMLIARSKLALDNSILGEGSRISTIRFDLEDWSRRIVAALADYLDKEKPGEFPAHHMREYLAFVHRSTSTNFNDLGVAEGNALRLQICERMRFNFLVISVSMDDFNVQSGGASKGFLDKIVVEWNRVFGSAYEDLNVCVDEEILERASIIEQAYLVALLAGSPGAKFIEGDIRASDWVTRVFAEENRDVLKSAETSFVDKKRYDRLRGYVSALVVGSREQT